MCTLIRSSSLSSFQIPGSSLPGWDPVDVIERRKLAPFSHASFQLLGRGVGEGAKALRMQGAFVRWGSGLPCGEQKVLALCRVVRDTQVGRGQLGFRPGEGRIVSGPQGEDPWGETLP